ncbi:MAG TPA: response regulator transcription factor [Acidimicrobiales bacterium]|nr:response regulator transcription factor [Acidimicrobiales bacterium]
MSEKRLSVLVVEDTESYVEALTIGLGREGFHVEVARDGAEALARFAEVDPDVILLDLMLPKVSGVDVCREIRASSTVPIIMVTAKGDEVDTVVGLEVGADDYVVKPYRMRELVARIRAVLRRRLPPEVAPTEETSASTFTVGDVHLDVTRHRVTVGGHRVDLPLKEFEVLAVLLERVGFVIPRDRLIERVWGYDYVGDTKTLDVHIKRLRARIEPDPARPSRIVTVRGVGYRYEEPAD